MNKIVLPSNVYPNLFHSDRWQVSFSNLPTLESIRDMRIYDNFVKSVSFPEYTMNEIYSDTMGFRIRHPVGGIKANTDLSQISIEFKLSEDMKNYSNLFNWMQSLKYGKVENFNKEEEFFRKYTIKSINLSILDNKKRPIAFWRFSEAFLLSLGPISLNQGISDEITFLCNFSYEEILFESKLLSTNNECSTGGESPVVTVPGVVVNRTSNAILSDGSIPMIANLSIGNFRIINLANPVNPTDAANKRYVDNLIVQVSANDINLQNEINQLSAAIQNIVISGGSSSAVNIELSALSAMDNFLQSEISALSAQDIITENEISQLQTIINAISPAAPLAFGGTLNFTGTKYSAILPTGLTSAWYADGSIAGNTITDYMVSNTSIMETPNITSAFMVGTAFETARGTLIHIEDGINNESRAISAGVGVTGQLQITSLTTYNSIWQKANARINAVQSTEGFKKHSMKYIDGATILQTGDIAVRYDNVNSTPSFSTIATIVQNVISSSRYLSGIRYYYLGDTFDISAQVTNIANRAIRPIDPISYIMEGLNNVNKAISGSSFAYNGVYTLNDLSVALNVLSAYSINDRIIITAKKPNGITATSQSISENRLVNTYSPFNSTNGNITMFDENYRFPLSADFSIIPISITGNWNSNLPLTNGNLVLFNSVWDYPSINYSSGYLPLQSVNYSGFTGNQVGVWASNIGMAHSSMRITFTGVTVSDVSPVGTGNLNIEIRLPNESGWLDCGKSFGDGNGCKLGSSSGNIFNLSFGTFTSSNSNGIVFIRVTLLNNSIAKASQMLIVGL